MNIPFKIVAISLIALILCVLWAISMDGKNVSKGEQKLFSLACNISFLSLVVSAITGIILA